MKKRYSLIAVGALLALSQAAFAQRGSSGHVNVLYWQAPSGLNPYLSTGTKDLESASLVVEPLIRFNEKGEMIPALAEEVPTVANGGFAADFKTITYKIKRGIKWSDGSPFTAGDVVFTYEYCSGAKGCARSNTFAPVDKVVAVNDLTVRITFKAAKPYPYDVFGGATTPILQRAQFKDCTGDRGPSCSKENFNPIGTGPFMIKDFRPNDVIQMVANPNFRDPAKPAFATLTLKGGG